MGETMLRRKLLFVFAVVLVLGLAGCSEPEDKYYFAIYTITQATADSMTFNRSPNDALDWVKAQTGTGAAPNQSYTGYSLEDVLNRLASLNFSETLRTRVSNGLKQSGYYYNWYTTGSTPPGYRFLYINRE